MPKIGIRSTYVINRLTWLSTLRPPSASTFAAKACHAVYAGHHPSFVGRFCFSWLSRYVYARSSTSLFTSYFSATPRCITCTTFAVRYGDSDEHSPGQNEKPPSPHWNL